MRVLEQGVRENPEYLDAAEEVMAKIREQRATYNEQFERLIDNLVNSPDEIERTLQIIDRMEELDEYPNERVVEQVTEARVIAQLAYDRDRAATIMAEAAELIDEERYADAVERYLSGFDLQRERFEEREYGNILRNRVTQAIATVRSNGERFVELSPEYREEVTSLTQAARNNVVDTLPGLVDAYADVFTRMEVQQTAVTDAAGVLSEQSEQVAAIFPEDPVDWHIRLIRRFAVGRQDVDRREGIAGALQTAQQRSRFVLTGEFTSSADAALAEAATALEGRLWEQAQSPLSIAREHGSAGLRVAVINTGADVDMPLAEAIAALPFRLRALYADQHVRRETAVARSSLATVMAEVDETRLPLEETTDIPTLSQSKETLAGHVETIRDQISEWEALAEEYGTLAADTLSASADEYVSATGGALSTREAEVVEYEISTLNRIAGIRYESLSGRFDAGEADYREGLDLLEGVEEVVARPQTPPGEAAEGEGETAAEDVAESGEPVTVTYRYPDRALQQFLGARDDLQALRTDVAAALESYRAEDAYVRTDERIAERITDTEELLADIDELSQNVASRITSARDQIARAQELRNEGDNLVAQTRQAITNLNVERARELWEQARQRYFESLELQQDAAFRDQSDELITELGAEIQEARNRRIVQQVRQQINRADTLYEQENYQEAYDVLTDARDLWQQTNVEPNPEIERLLRFVNAALNLESTRTLAETEPLYPVLSSYLNLARQDYSQAQNIVQVRGTTDQAQQLLTRAEDNVDNVVAVRPYNWEARILKLRILRLQDSENFDEVFERRFEEAIDRKDEDPQEALTAFETLAAINPDYPGLQEQIVELEIDLGIRPDPVTQQQIAESNQLLDQAQEIASGAGEAQRQAAISLLEEAVTLNPENNEAQILLDRLRIQSGGEATVTLTSAEEQQFRRAETLFIQDNVAQAYAIVQQLLQEEENRRYPPLLDLEERIAARLGI